MKGHKEVGKQLRTPVIWQLIALFLVDLNYYADDVEWLIFHWRTQIPLCMSYQLDLRKCPKWPTWNAQTMSQTGCNVIYCSLPSPLQSTVHSCPGSTLRFTLIHDALQSTPVYSSLLQFTFHFQFTIHSSPLLLLSTGLLQSTFHGLLLITVHSFPPSTVAQLLTTLVFSSLQSSIQFTLIHGPLQCTVNSGQRSLPVHDTPQLTVYSSSRSTLSFLFYDVGLGNRQKSTSK